MAKYAGDHKARKRFGQNFLQDQTVIERIVASVQPKPADNCVEIGPGLGALTIPLLKACGTLQVIELDRDLIPRLRGIAASVGELIIYEQDALTFNFHDCEKEHQKIRLVGNLPYNISTPLLFHVFDQIALIQDMHFMLQKEVVDRMAASPSTKAYGRLSVMVQYYCGVQPLFEVPPHAFVPAPKVTSTVVRLKPHVDPVRAKDEALLSAIVRDAFNQRRKTISNSLKMHGDVTLFEACGIDPKMRAEDLTLNDYIKLANHLAP